MSALENLRARVTRATGGSEPRRWVGLDLGTQSLKLVELEQTADGARLMRHLVQELPAAGPAGGAEGQPLPDRVGWLQAALKEFDAAELHVSLSGPEVAIRRLHVPLMSKRELPEAVKWQVKDQLSFPVQEAVLDLRILGEVWDKDIKKQDILVAAAPASAVQEAMAAVERAGGHVASLAPTQCAAWRCATALIPEARQGAVAVIEVGAQKTEVTVIKDGQVQLVRNLGLGSASVTEALVGVVTSEQGTMTIDSAMAESIARTHGVLSEDTRGTTDEGVPLFHISSLMRPVLENLLTELSRVLNFYKTQTDDAGISRALLCGGGANLKQLQRYLTDGLGLPMETLNPLVRLPDRAQAIEPARVAEDGPRLAVAVGLALDHGETLNLIPPEVRRTRVAAVSRDAWLKVGKAGAALAGALYLALWFFAGVLEWQVGSQRKVWMHLEPTYAECMGVIQASQKVRGSMVELQQFIDQQPVWDGVLKAVGSAMPSSIMLDQLAAESRPPRLHLTGRAEAGEGSIAKLMEGLEQSIFFVGVELASSEMRTGDSGATSFEIEGQLE